jgi:hypothetical protein
MTLVSTVNLMLSSLTVVSQIIIGFVVLSFAIRNEKLTLFFGKNKVDCFVKTVNCG